MGALRDEYRARRSKENTSSTFLHLDGYILPQRRGGAFIQYFIFFFLNHEGSKGTKEHKESLSI